MNEKKAVNITIMKAVEAYPLISVGIIIPNELIMINNKGNKAKKNINLRKICSSSNLIE